MGEIVRWEVEPLARSRRGLDERLRLWFPGVSVRLAKATARRPAGSRMRRAGLTRTVRVAWAATNRGDFESALAALHPDVEFYPPELGPAVGFEPVYRGPDAVRRFTEQWVSGFQRFRYEPREIADPGGPHFAIRLEMIAAMPDSDTEVRSEMCQVVTLRDGLVIRQENDPDWDAALAALARADEAAAGP